MVALIAFVASLGAFATSAGAAVYWVDGDAIGRMNLDGTNPSPGLIWGYDRPLSTPCGLAVDDSHLYWADKNRNVIGRSNLEGKDRELDFIAGAQEPCGLAVDSRVFGPAYIAPPPLPPWTPCKIDRVRVNKWNGSALVRLSGPTFGRFGVRTRGLRWRVISRRPPSKSGQAAWPWWIRLRPGTKGRAARHLRRRLARTGDAPVNVRIACSEEGSVDNRSVRRLVLHKRSTRRRGSGRALRSAGLTG